GDQASGEEPDRKVEWAEVDKRRLAMTAGATLLGIGSMIGRRHLEKRWLAALQESGHPHPYRALGVRMGLVATALALPGALRERR
ncbi:hypothetical protein AB0M20_39650, partial [Actinoplanes sp. NPDC051633]|uniref:hypothetical protein n=1 Tax=Actinoplanes sp. NPDC051633 TaxID=3155670 RepID=UPI00341CDC66